MSNSSGNKRRHSNGVNSTKRPKADTRTPAAVGGVNAGGTSSREPSPTDVFNVNGVCRDCGVPSSNDEDDSSPKKAKNLFPSPPNYLFTSSSSTCLDFGLDLLVDAQKAVACNECQIYFGCNLKCNINNKHLKNRPKKLSCKQPYHPDNRHHKFKEFRRAFVKFHQAFGLMLYDDDERKRDECAMANDCARAKDKRESVKSREHAKQMAQQKQRTVASSQGIVASSASSTTIIRNKKSTANPPP